MNLRDAAQKGYDDGYDGRHESELTVETMFHDLVGLGDEVEGLKHAYAFAYGRGVARRQYDDGELGGHDFDHFMYDFLPFGDWSGLSEVAHEGYHAERERFDDEEREREEDEDQTDKADPDYSGTDSGGGETATWRDAPIIALGLLLSTKPGWIILGSTIFLAVGYCQHQAQPIRDAQPASSYPEPSAEPHTEEPSIASTGQEARIEMLALFEGVDAEYQPLGAATDVLEVNHPYGSPVRTGVAASFRFSGAHPGKTRFRTEIWEAYGRFREGTCIPDRRLWQTSGASENWVSSAEEGNFVCAYQGPMLPVGDYRVQVIVDENPTQSLNFRVVPKIMELESPAVIGYGSRDQERENIQQTREAWQRHHERMRAIDAKVAEFLRVHRDCFPDGEPCTTFNAQHRRDIEVSEAILRKELHELR